MKPTALQILPLEIRRSIISFRTQLLTRNYATSGRAAVKAPHRTPIYRGRAVKRTEEGPSPLSPVSRVTRVTAISNPTELSTTGSTYKTPQRERENTESSEYRTSSLYESKKRPKGQPAKLSNVAGTSPTRRLLVTPAMDRISRVPVWARPPTTTEEHGKLVTPPTGKSWAEHRANIKAKYPGKWSPSKKVSTEAMGAIRELHKTDPDKYPTWVLAQRFTISPDAIRRILKSKWRMPEDRLEEKIMKERARRIERVKRMREEEMHLMVRAGIKLKVHPDDELRLK